MQPFGFFATIEGLGGDGLVPVSTLGAEHFGYDEAAQTLVGSDSGTRYAPGDRIRLRLGEANPLTGALKFELPDGEGQIEPRGERPAPRRRNHPRQGRRGRPANIRHQGRGKPKR